MPNLDADPASAWPDAGLGPGPTNDPDVQTPAIAGPFTADLPDGAVLIGTD
ncbi:MAG: hypothetical protein U5L08_10685 [Xanthomonadales bacterium]|nr:hypothetical protein [Xanthomonadales bacterium]